MTDSKADNSKAENSKAENGTPRCKFKESDRVRRAPIGGVGSGGASGTVKEIRFELENSGISLDAREKGAMIGVQWDSGLFSYFSPEALESAAD